jgi:hypothetical protein
VAQASVDLGFMSLLDRMALMAPDGYQANIVELLTHFNPMLQDMHFEEGNLATGHQLTSRVGLPAVAARQFNKGIAPSRSKYNQWVEAATMLGGWSTVDQDLARLGGDEMAARVAEDKGFIMELNNQMETYIFYANAGTTPELFEGLAPRFASLTQKNGGSQVIRCMTNDTGSVQSSIWLVGWGPETAFGFWPKGQMGGIEVTDFGLLPVDPLGNGSKMPAWQAYWRWNLGLAVKDYRYIARVCDFDTGAESGTTDVIIPAMILAYHQIYNINAARFGWYLNRNTGAYLHLQARNKTQYQLQVSEPGGDVILSMLGIPIRISDALTNTEAYI